MTRLILTISFLLYATVAFAGSHHRERRDMPRWYSYEHPHNYRYYDGPRSDYSTRWYGENAGTVHYGY